MPAHLAHRDRKRRARHILWTGHGPRPGRPLQRERGGARAVAFQMIPGKAAPGRSAAAPLQLGSTHAEPEGGRFQSNIGNDASNEERPRVKTSKEKQAARRCIAPPARIGFPRCGKALARPAPRAFSLAGLPSRPPARPECWQPGFSAGPRAPRGRTLCLPRWAGGRPAFGTERSALLTLASTLMCPAAHPGVNGQAGLFPCFLVEMQRKARHTY